MRVTIHILTETRTARLCFDPTDPGHFNVIEYVVDENENVTGLEIYSSITGSWSFVENGWDDDVMLCDRRRSVFLNGFLHSVISDAIVAVDTEAKKWRTIPTPTDNECGFIYPAQGRLCLINVADGDSFKLSIWTLDDHAANEWILKHTVSTLRLFGGKRIRFDFDYQVIAIHPEGNTVFFIFGWNNTLMAYIIDRREVRVIRDLGHDCSDPYFPYVPFFLEAPVDGQ